MVELKMFISKNKVYTFLLLILPMLVAVSWLNVFFGNANYELTNYILTFILPSVVLTYIVTLITAEYLNKLYGFNSQRFNFTIAIMIVSLSLYALVFRYLGTDVTFITAHFSSIQEYESAVRAYPNNTQLVDPRELGSKFYSFQLLLVMIVMVIFYSISIAIFRQDIEDLDDVDENETVIVDLKKESKKVSKSKKIKASPKKKRK